MGKQGRDVNRGKTVWAWLCTEAKWEQRNGRKEENKDNDWRDRTKEERHEEKENKKNNLSGKKQLSGILYSVMVYLQKSMIAL